MHIQSAGGIDLSNSETTYRSLKPYVPNIKTGCCMRGGAGRSVSSLVDTTYYCAHTVWCVAVEIEYIPTVVPEGRATVKHVLRSRFQSSGPKVQVPRFRFQGLGSKAGLFLVPCQNLLRDLKPAQGCRKSRAAQSLDRKWHGTGRLAALRMK